MSSSSETKEEQLEPTLLPLPHHDLHFKADDAPNRGRKRTSGSTLLPSIVPRHHHISSYTNFSSLRPHSADSSLPRPHPASSTSTFFPLFSSTHRITAAGNIVHLTQAEADAFALHSLSNHEHILESRRAETVSGAGRERILILEPLVVHSKVDSGLHGGHSKDAKEEVGNEQLHGAERGDEERRRRRLERAVERRRQRRLQREEREGRAASHQREKEERKEQIEEKIEPEPPQQRSSSPVPPTPLSPASHVRSLRVELRKYHEQADLRDSLLAPPSSLPSFAAASDGAAEPSPAAISAAIQAHVAQRVLGPATEDGLPARHSSLEARARAEDVRRRDIEQWRKGRSRSRPNEAGQAPRSRIDEVLLWSDQHPPSHRDSFDAEEDAQEDAQFSDDSHTSDDSSDSYDSAEGSDVEYEEEGDDSPEMGSTDSRADPTTTQHGIVAGAEGTSRPSTVSSDRSFSSSAGLSDVGTPRSSSSIPSRPSSSHSRQGEAAHSHHSHSRSTRGAHARDRQVRKGKTVKWMQPERGGKAELDEGQAKRVRGRRGSQLFDPSPVTLGEGASIRRDSVFVHHAREVKIIVDLLNDAAGSGGLNLAYPISVGSLGERGLVGAERGPREGQTEEEKKLHSPSKLTTVLHGKDMMIVLKWLTQLASRYIAEVLGRSEYAEERPPAPATAEATGSPSAPPRSAPPPPLDFLGLDRRSLYKRGLTNESIDQMYSGVYAYSVGFFQLLSGLVLPNLTPSSEQSPAAFMRRLWWAYRRLLELAHPPLYQWVLHCMEEVARDEAKTVYAAHVKEVEKSGAVVRGRREEVQRLKVDYAAMFNQYEDTLDGISEARVTRMSLQETNFLEERALSLVSDDSIADLTAKATRAVAHQQAVYDGGVRLREKRAQTVKAIHQAREDIHLGHLHHDDLQRLIATHTSINTAMEDSYPAHLAQVETAESAANTAASISLALLLTSFQHLGYNRHMQHIIDAQLQWIKGAQKRGLLTSIREDAWEEVKGDVVRGYDEAQEELVRNVRRETQLEGVSMEMMEGVVRRAVAESDPLSVEQKTKMGLLQFERERDRRVLSAQQAQDANTATLLYLTSQLSALSDDLQLVKASYSRVYGENESIIGSNSELQATIDGLLTRLDVLLSQQSTTGASIDFTKSEVAQLIAELHILPTQIEAVRAATSALIPREAELTAVEAAKGEVFRALLQEKEKLDGEFARAVRDGDELKVEMEELMHQLVGMEEKAKPLWRELDGKLGVLERELEYQRMQWEIHQMRRCEEETTIKWRVDGLQRWREKLQPREEEVVQVQTEAEAVRSVLKAEEAVHDAIRLELREARERMQAKAKEKEEFLALHIASNHEQMDRRAQAVGHLAHLNDVLEHTRSELRASHAVTEQMATGFEKRLQQWKAQVEGRKDANRKRFDLDQQRRDVQLLKRAELVAVIDAVKADFEAEEERRRQTQETLEMMQQEFMAEQEHSVAMLREKERLERFHSELSLAGPHLQRELDRVTAKDRDFDVREVERAIQGELEKRGDLMRRVAVMEEEEAFRRIHRVERWIQTDPSRHFMPSVEDDSRERFVLGRELGLMTDEWVKEKQSSLREVEEKEESADGLTAATRGRVLYPSAALVKAHERTSKQQIGGGDGDGEAAIEAVNSASPRIVTRRRSESAIAEKPVLPPRAAEHFGQGDADVPRGGRHARTHTTHVPSSWLMQTALQEEDEEDEKEEFEQARWTPPQASRDGRWGHHQRGPSARVTSQPTSPKPVTSPSGSRSRPSSGTSSRPSTATSRAGRSRPTSATGSVTPSSSGEKPILNQTVSATRKSSFSARPRTGERSHSPHSPFTPAVMDAAAMIPTTAMRALPSSILPLSLASLSAMKPSTVHAPQSPPISSSLSQAARQVLHEVTARTYDAVQKPVNHGEDAEHEEEDEVSAREQGHAYEKFMELMALVTEQARQQQQAATAVDDRAPTVSAGLPDDSSWPPIPPPSVEAAAGAVKERVPTPRRHRGAVNFTQRAGSGAVSDWLEMQVRKVMEEDQRPKRRSAASNNSHFLPHGHLSLMMPDTAQPLPRASVTSEPSESDEDWEVDSPAPSPPMRPSVQPKLDTDHVGPLSPEVTAPPHEMIASLQPAQLVDAAEVTAMAPLLEVLRGTAWGAGRWKPSVLSPPDARGVLMRVKDKSRPPTDEVKVEVVKKERPIPEDEQPGRLPNYIKRSIRLMYKRRGAEHQTPALPSTPHQSQHPHS